MATVVGWWKWGCLWLATKKAKRVTGIVKIILGAIIMSLGFVIALKPDPFLQFGYAGVFMFNALSGPGMLLLPTLSLTMNGFWLAAVSAIGMAVNDSVSWWVGTTTENLIDRGKKLEKIGKTLERYGMVGLFFWSLLPFPYDLVGLAAGYLGIPYWKYIIPTFLGKFVRFWLICIGVVQVANARM